MLPTTLLEQAILAGRFIMVLAALAYLLPLGALSMRAWSTLLLSTIATRFMLIVLSVGKPKLNMQYASEVMQCVWTPMAFTPLLLMIAHPLSLMLPTLVGLDLLAVGNFLYASTSGRAPAVSNNLRKLADLALPVLSGRAPAELATMRTPAKWRLANESMMRGAAVTEIMAAIS
ncbi:hypothetical protein EON67_02130, partial [archaeon]